MTAYLWPAAALLIAAMLSFAALRAWRGWLDLQRYRIAIDRGLRTGDPNSASRIELADVRERLRKLEAIATGVDL